MKRNLSFVLLISLLACTTLSFSQIQVTQASFAGVGNEYDWHGSSDEQTVDVGSPGANQTWDFTGLAFDVPGSFSVVDPASTPYAHLFPTATMVTENIDQETNYGVYNYQRVASDGVYYQGMVMETGDGSIETSLDEEVREIPFPLTYNTPTWTSVAHWSIEMAPGFVMVMIDSSIRDVDAWGTVQTAFGSYEVLRVFDHDWMTIDYGIGTPIQTENVAYTWITADGVGSINIMGPTDEIDPNFTQGLAMIVSAPLAVDKPRGPIAENFSVGQNYPNPFNPTTSLPISLSKAGKVEITIYNELGEIVSQQTQSFGPGNHTVGFDGSAWASGNYFAQVSADGVSQTKRMTLVK